MGSRVEVAVFQRGVVLVVSTYHLMGSFYFLFFIFYFYNYYLFLIFIGLRFYFHLLCFRNKDKLIKLNIFLEVKKVTASSQTFCAIIYYI